MPRRTTKRKYRAKSKSKRTKRKRKPSAKVVAARKKAKQKRVRRVKLINKTIRRVQTKLADEKGVMYRQKLTQIRAVNMGVPGPPTEQVLDILGNANDGDFIKHTTVGLPFKHQDYFTMDAFHGICMPKWTLNSDQGLTEDPNWEKIVQSGAWVPQERIGIGATFAGEAMGNALDIRALRTVKLPFLPCIPKWIDTAINPANTPFPNWQAEKLKWNELDRFARKGDRIKILNNYFRFKFYVRPDNQGIRGVYKGVPQNPVTDTIISGMISAGNSVPPGGPGAGPWTLNHLLQNNPVLQDGLRAVSAVTEGATNQLLTYTLTTKPSAHVRIIIVSRDSGDNNPIEIEDFLKENAQYSMGDEGYRMERFFYRKKKTERDFYRNTTSALSVTNQFAGQMDPDPKDTSLEQQRVKANVQFHHDKVYKLKVGFNMIRLNPLKGKVLTYEHSDPTIQGAQGNSGILNTEGVFAEGEDIQPEATGAANFILPTDTEALLTTISQQDQTGARTNAMRMEYVPKGRTYAMFMMVKNVRCSTEWDIFQKFEYDK